MGKVLRVAQPFRKKCIADRSQELGVGWPVLACFGRAEGAGLPPPRPVSRLPPGVGNRDDLNVPRSPFPVNQSKRELSEQKPASRVRADRPKLRSLRIWASARSPSASNLRAASVLRSRYLSNVHTVNG
jgi:hypothetical protein